MLLDKLSRYLWFEVFESWSKKNCSFDMFISFPGFGVWEKERAKYFEMEWSHSSSWIMRWVPNWIVYLSKFRQSNGKCITHYSKIWTRRLSRRWLTSTFLAQAARTHRRHLGFFFRFFIKKIGLLIYIKSSVRKMKIMYMGFKPKAKKCDLLGF